MPGSSLLAPSAEQPPRKPEPLPEVPTRKQESQESSAVESLNRSLEQARATHQRIQSIDIPGNARLAAIKDRSTALLRSMEALKMKATQGAPIEEQRLQKQQQRIIGTMEGLVAEAQANVAEPSVAERTDEAEAPLELQPETTKPEETPFQQHLATQPLELQPEQPVQEKTPFQYHLETQPLELADEPADVAADRAESATVLESPTAPHETSQTKPESTAAKPEPAPAPREIVLDRAAAWKELQSVLANAEEARQDFFATKDQLSSLRAELKPIEQKLGNAAEHQERINALTKQIVDLHELISGAEYAAQVREQLSVWTTRHQKAFDEALSQKFFNDIKYNTGSGGLMKQIAEAKRTAERAAPMDKLMNKLQSIVGYTEVGLLEYKQQQAQKQIAAAMDELVERMQQQNRASYLQDREKELLQQKEREFQQVEFDKTISGLMNQAQSAERSAAQIKQRLSAFTERLPADAAAALRDLPETVPVEQHHTLSASDRVTYERLAAQYHAKTAECNQLIDRLHAMAKDGIAAYRRPIEAQEPSVPSAPAKQGSGAETEEPAVEIPEPEQAAAPSPEQIRLDFFHETTDRIKQVVNESFPGEMDVEKDLHTFLQRYLDEDTQEFVESIYDVIQSVDASDPAKVEEAKKTRDTLVNHLKTIFASESRGMRDIPEEEFQKPKSEDRKKKNEQLKWAVEFMTNFKTFTNNAQEWFSSKTHRDLMGHSPAWEKLQELREFQESDTEIVGPASLTRAEKQRIVDLMADIQAATSIGGDEAKAVSKLLETLPTSAPVKAESAPPATERSETDAHFHANLNSLLDYADEWLAGVTAQDPKLQQAAADWMATQELFDLRKANESVSSLTSDEKKRLAEQMKQLYILMNGNVPLVPKSTEPGAYEIRQMAKDLGMKIEYKPKQAGKPERTNTPGRLTRAEAATRNQPRRPGRPSRSTRGR